MVLLSYVRRKEYLRGDWRVPERQKYVKNLIRVIDHSNIIGNFITTEILKCGSFKERINTISFFIHVVQVCLDFMG